MSWVGIVTGRPSAGLRCCCWTASDSRLGLRLGRQRQVRHLVAVEVRVERGADQRMDLDGLALDQLRLEGLDAQPVQVGAPVEQHRMLGDDLLEDIPDDRRARSTIRLALLMFCAWLRSTSRFMTNGLNSSIAMPLERAALVQFRLRADDDDRPAGVVDALAQQVLPEPALLALEHVRDRLQRPVARPGDRPAAPTLSNNASTDSCSIRFSLFTMISGAPRSSSRLSGCSC